MLFSLLDLPLELLHLIFFDLWILDHADIAAVRATCRKLRNSVLTHGLDLWKWEARAGPKWCRELNLTNAIMIAYSMNSPYKLTSRIGETLLKEACLRPNVRIAKFVLSRFPNKRLKPKRPIEIACGKGCVELVRLLAERSIRQWGSLPENMNIKPWRTRFPKGTPVPKFEIVELLLSYGWVPSDETFVWICKTGCVRSVIAMLDHGVDLARVGGLALRAACLHNIFDGLQVMSVLLDCGVDLSFEDNICIQRTSAMGNFKTTRLLLEYGADPSANNSIALFLASRNGHDQVVKLLLAAGSGLSGDVYKSLMTACRGGHMEVIRAILSYCEFPPQDLAKAAKVAFDNGHLNARVAPLLDSYYPVRHLYDCRTLGRDQVNEQFHAACEMGLTDLARELLQSGRCSPNANCDYAIRAASFRGHADIVARLLADVRVNPAAGDNQAIRQASLQGHADIVALLLADERVNPAAAYNQAIRQASLQGHADIVALLLADERVNPAAAYNQAIRHAILRGHSEVAALLLSDARVAAMWDS